MNSLLQFLADVATLIATMLTVVFGLLFLTVFVILFCSTCVVLAPIALLVWIIIEFLDYYDGRKR